MNNELDLYQFHHINSHGVPTGVYDFKIHEYVKQNYHLFVMGSIPYIYEKGVFRQDANGSNLKTIIRDLILPQFVKAPTIKRIYDLFISDARLQMTAQEINSYPKYWINFTNGMYDPIDNMMMPHDPCYYAINQIPHDFIFNANCNNGFASDWINSLFDKDDDREMLLQYIGYCMTIDTSQQKLLILNGSGGTGKSTLIKVVNAMVGSDNIASISLNSLTSNRFASFGLVGKLVNSCADLEIDALTDTSTVKKVLGEDSIMSEAKGKDAIQFTSYAKLLFSTNELPIVKCEKTNGFYRRLLILSMNKIPPNKDTRLFNKLEEHIDDFISLSVQALRRMYKNGPITESENSIEAVKKLWCDSDTVEAFLNDCCVKDRREKTKKLVLYQKYEDYCTDTERQSLTKKNFFKSMELKGFSQYKTGGTDYFKGILLSENLPKNSLNSPFTDCDEDIPFK